MNAHIVLYALRTSTIIAHSRYQQGAQLSSKQAFLCVGQGFDEVLKYCCCKIKIMQYQIRLVSQMSILQY